MKTSFLILPYDFFLLPAVFAHVLASDEQLCNALDDSVIINHLYSSALSQRQNFRIQPGLWD